MSKLQFATVTGTKAFLDAVTNRAKAFKASKGFGRWLKEYEEMEAQGLFKPERLIDIYKNYLNKRSRLGFLQNQAAYYICTLALEDTYSLLNDNKFDIWIEELNDYYLDEDGDKVDELEFMEALYIATAINKDTLDFLVCIVEHETKQVVWKQNL